MGSESDATPVADDDEPPESAAPEVAAPEVDDVSLRWAAPTTCPA
jgi:hypothetical protein